MGTRNMTCAYIDDEYRVAQYGQWDGYPDGVGVDILNTLISVGIEILKDKILKCKSYSNEDRSNFLAPYCDNEGYLKKEYNELYTSVFQFDDRDIGGKIFDKILSSVDGVGLHVDIEYAIGEDTWCEWFYVVDFDKLTFEVYDHPFISKTDRGIPFAEYMLNALPSVEVFIDECNKKEEEHD